MKEKTVQIDRVQGISNVVDPERLATNDLYTGVNVDLDGGGKPSRRLGTTRRVTATTPKGLWSDGQAGYFLDGTTLTQFVPPATKRTLRTGLSAVRRPLFVAMQGVVYYTNGQLNGRIVNGVSRSWGTAVPRLTTLAASAGQLRAGTYGVTIAYARENGQVSGCYRMEMVAVNADGGVTVALPTSTDTEVSHVQVYATSADGEVPFLVGEATNGTASFSYTRFAGTVEADTMGKGPPPPGHLLARYKDRILIASGRYLWFTDPFNPELVDYRRGYIPLDGEATILAPTTSGVYVATRGRTIFLHGDTPEQFVVRNEYTDGAPLGNYVEASGDVVTGDGIKGNVVGWMSNSGWVVGDSDGNVVNMIQRRYVLPAGTERTASVYKQRGGLTQFISVLHS